MEDRSRELSNLVLINRVQRQQRALKELSAQQQQLMQADDSMALSPDSAGSAEKSGVMLQLFGSAEGGDQPQSSDEAKEVVAAPPELIASRVAAAAAEGKAKELSTMLDIKNAELAAANLTLRMMQKENATLKNELVDSQTEAQRVGEFRRQVAQLEDNLTASRKEMLLLSEEKQRLADELEASASKNHITDGAADSPVLGSTADVAVEESPQDDGEVSGGITSQGPQTTSSASTEPSSIATAAKTGTRKNLAKSFNDVSGSAVCRGRCDGDYSGDGLDESAEDSDGCSEKDSDGCSEDIYNSTSEILRLQRQVQSKDANIEALCEQLASLRTMQIGAERESIVYFAITMMILLFMMTYNSVK